MSDPERYTFVTSERTWADARAYCQSIGADLVAIEMLAEMTYLAGLAGGHSYWIGWNDIETEGIVRIHCIGVGVNLV